jgi:N-acetylmuramoyl-L-alanine amidase
MIDLSVASDIDVLARTAWGEARSLGALGMQATLNTMQNRKLSHRTWWGKSLREIALFGRDGRHQYSCWNTNDPNCKKLLEVADEDPQFKVALGLASLLVSGQLPDVTNGADSYFDKRMPRWPMWYLGLTPVWQLGPHLYFNTVDRLASAVNTPSAPPLPVISAGTTAEPSLT